MDHARRPPIGVTLSRDLNLFTVTMIGVGGMIGAGIFVLTGIAAGVAGPALVLAFLLNGLITTLTAMSYAELGSAFPEAGGGYVWVKAALGGTQGFLSGWMSWFAAALAGSLYALAFGRFGAEMMSLAGVVVNGLSVQQLSMIFSTLVILLFTWINYRGASETGKVGNVVTLAKVLILLLFVVFGIAAMLRSEAWIRRFSTGFMPNGFLGVLTAMGLTFIAFEGYEIIAQSGEEIINPKRNIPRAIFLSIAIAVVIYLLVGVAAIGAVAVPDGRPAFQYLGEQREIAVIEVARQTFPLGIGGVVLLLSGLASTMSALNATTYSSSRVSFAMGRENNLPAFFAAVHPRRHTPSYAVLGSGALMIAMAWALPLEGVAAAADIMFLLLFLMVNLSALVLRRQRPDLDRGFRIPLMPALPILAVVCNLILAAHLFTFSALAWYTAGGWIVFGLIAYLGRFSRIEAMEKPKEILHEEVLVSRDYSVLVPVANETQARILGDIGAILAQGAGGEVLALHVVQVPPQLTLGEGRLFLREGRGYLESVIEQAKQRGVPVHTVIRLGRGVAEAVRKTALENASDQIVLGWPGYTNTSGKLFGSVIDPIVDNPPTDVVVVRYRQRRPVNSILVPVAGGPNSRRAVKVAVAMARAGENGLAAVVLLHVLPLGASLRDHVRAEQELKYALEGTDYAPVQTLIVEAEDVADAVLQHAEEHDLIVMGATEEPLFRNFLVGRLTERIARRAPVTVVMVKRRSSPLHSFVRQALLEPTEPKPLEDLPEAASSLPAPRGE